MQIEIELQWDKMSSSERALAAASYGQHIIGDRPKEVVYEMNIVDTRFTNDYSLPWDAYAEVEARGDIELLHLVGNSGPGGQGPTWGIWLPRDIKIQMRVWSHDEQPKEPEVPEIIQHFNQLKKNFEAVYGKYRVARGVESQGLMMDYHHAEVLIELGEHLRDEIYQTHDHQACIDGMVSLGWLVHLLEIGELGGLMGEWSY